ncbi:MAG: APHP domain-containing protein, partial [Verrucomicrobiaceae bacterium]
AQGGLWAATGGGPLLQLNPVTGQVIGEFGDGLTQALAIQPETGKIFVSSGSGVEVFDPVTQTFSHFSDVRVGSLAFAPQNGQLWAAAWPQRADVVRFDNQGKAETMLRFDAPVDSITFGPAGSALDGLLFVSANAGSTNASSALTMVDLATLNRVAIGTGGSRGDVVKATADGRIFLSQSSQVDVLSLALAPKVIGSNPSDGTLVILPRGSITLQFDQPMHVGAPGDAFSILNPLNYELRRSSGGTVPVQSVSYSSETNSVTLLFDALEPEGYELIASSLIRAQNGLQLQNAVTIEFTAINYFAPSVELQFTNARSNRAAGTVSYDIVLTNKGDFDLQAPLSLVLSPRAGVTAIPAGAQYVADKGVYLFDLSDELVGGKLRPGESLPLRTITVTSVTAGSAGFDFTVWALSTNEKPEIDSTPVTTATAGQEYQYQVSAQDPDGISLGYLLYKAPEGMSINAETGLITWLPTAANPTPAQVVVLVSDSRGATTTQEFTINAAGSNRAPVLDTLPLTINGREGQLLEVVIGATDPDGDNLTYWADNLPAGAVFDPATRILRWTPGAQDAGTYPNIRFLVTDGVHSVERTTTLLIAAVNDAPTLTPPADRTLREGDTLRFRLAVSDAEGNTLTFFSGNLPAGATLDPATGIFEWTPSFVQAGVYQIPFAVSDGQITTTGVTRVTVLGTNGAPVFEETGLFEVQENQQIRFRVFAMDPDNPSFEPLERNPDGSVTITEENQPTVTYTVSGLPAGATFDPLTGFFDWTPGFTAAGIYNVTFTATDSGDGTGVNAEVSVTIPLRVSNNNRAPEIAGITNRTINRGDILEIPVTTTDADGNPRILSAKSGLPFFALPSFATFVDNGDGTGLLRFAPGEGDRGNYTITLTATDNGDGGGAGAALTDELSFVLTVDSPNEAPKLAHIGNRIAVLGEELQILLKVSDLDQDALSFSATGLPPGAIIEPGAVYGTALLKWTPQAGETGTFNITVTVQDSGNGNAANIASAQQSFTIIARTQNGAPVLNQIGTQTLTENQQFTLALGASDPDGDTLVYSATNLPAGAVLNAQTGVLTWKPNIFQAGIYENITVAVTDGNKTASRSFSMVVTNLNQAPTLV